MPQLFHVLKRAHPQELLFQRADEPLDAAIAFRLAHEGRRRLHAQEGDLRLVVVAHVLAAVVVPVANAGRGPRAESAAVVAHPLPERLQGLEPRGFLGRVKAHAFRRAVIDRHEHRHLSILDRGRRSAVAGPDFVGPLGDDGSRVRILGLRQRARRREQLRFAHQPQHACLRRAHLLKAQPRPHFAMALAIKRRGRQDLADLSGQCLVAALRLRSAPPQHSLGLRGDAELIVKARTRHLPFPRYAHHAVESSREGRSGAAHGFDLRQAKGRAASRRWIFSRSNSLLMLRSATKDFSRWVSSFSTSASRALRWLRRRPETDPASRTGSRRLPPVRAGGVSDPRRAATAGSLPPCVLPTSIPARRAALREPPPSPHGLPAGPPKLVLSLFSQTPPCGFSTLFTTIPSPTKP